VKKKNDSDSNEFKTFRILVKCLFGVRIEHNESEIKVLN